jgi:hypothetical protein
MLSSNFPQRFPSTAAAKRNLMSAKVTQIVAVIVGRVKKVIARKSCAYPQASPPRIPAAKNILPDAG